MNKLLEKIKFWIKNSRPYSIPITTLSWLVAFTYGAKHHGDILLGLISFFGISLVHLATNLIDDYSDYKRLACDKEFLNNTKDIKCKYLKEGKATIKQLKNVIIFMLSIAAVIGAYLFFKSGFYVLLFAILGLIVAISYPRLSSRGLGDFAVIAAYGPLMFGGVYYVMTGEFAINTIILSIASAMFVNTILYAHMLMDYDEDVISQKTTLCTIIGSKSLALRFLLLFYTSGYFFISILAIREQNPKYLITYITIPLIIDLYKSLKSYNEDKFSIPEPRFWNYPLDNWKKLKTSKSAPFFFRFLITRNISTWFMLLTCFAIIF